MKINGIQTIKGFKENVHTYRKSQSQNRKIDISSTQKSKLSQMYEDWGQGKLNLAEIQQYKKEQNDIKNTANETNNSYSKWTNFIRQLYAYLDMAKAKIHSMKEEVDNTGTSQSKLASFFGALKPIVSRVTNECQKISKTFFNLVNPLNYIKKAISGISSRMKGISSTAKQSLKHILKYTMALLSLRSIYQTLKSSATSWLSSGNAQAQQLNTNIEYMKNSLGNALAPVIQRITNLLHIMMKAIQSVVYALFKVNIFANASSKSFASMTGNVRKAKEESKQLAGIHDEINNVSNNNKNNGSDSGGVTPSFDLSKMDTQMNQFTQKLYDFFKPLVDSWNTYGQEVIKQLKTTISQIENLISSVWGSFENIITNGTVYSILENILAIIGNIAEAFANAWNNDGNGDAIVQNLADAFSNLLIIIKNIASSTIFQWLLDVGVGAIKIITDVIKKLTDAILWVSEKMGEFIGYFTGENSEKLDGWAIIIGSIATAIGLVVGAITLWNIVSAIATAVTTAFGIAINILTSPITLVILAIAALIAIIVLVAQNWEWLSQKATEICKTIVETVSNWTNNVKQWFINLINNIKTSWNNFWTNLFSKCSEIVNNIKNTISNWSSNIKTTISKVIDSIVNTFKDLPQKALTWGKDMIQGFINGIKNMLGNLADAAKNVGNKIKEFLHFSRPDKGPLREYEKWMPDMIQGLSKTLNDSAPKLYNASKELAKKVADSLDIASLLDSTSYTINTDGISNMIPTYSNNEVNSNTQPQNAMYDIVRRALIDSDISNRNNDGRPIRVQIYWGTREVIDEVIDGINEKTRRTGKAQIKVDYA